MKNESNSEAKYKLNLTSPDIPTSPSTNELTHKSGKSSTDSLISLNFPFSPQPGFLHYSSPSIFSSQGALKKVSKDMRHFPAPRTARKPPPKPKFISPARALLDYFEVLTPYEHSEISLFDEIYFVGPDCTKNTSNFDDSDGYYKSIPGDHLEYRYEIKSQLGSGTFGEVFNCFDYKRQMNVAVKIIRNKQIHRKAGDLEKKILYELSKADPDDLNCIVKKLRSFEFRGHLCLVFELLSLNLFDFLAKNEYRGLSIQLVRRIAVQLFMALKTVHSVGIIHCDLKPENILLKFENKSSIKVIDFGSACQDGNKVFDYIQSRFYRSPEVVIEAGYDKAIDIWSVGCILFELVTGSPLFPAQNEQELFKLITEVLGYPPVEWVQKGKRKQYYVDHNGQIRKPVVPLSRPLRTLMEGFDGSLVDLIEKCLKWVPSERIQAEEGLSHEWVRGSRHKIV